MATFYTIQTLNVGNTGQNYRTLYETFDDACDAVEEQMKSSVNYDETYFQKNKREREILLKEMEERGEVLYFILPLSHEFYITKMTVVPKKPDTVDCDVQDKYIEENFEEVFKRSQKVKSVNGKPEENMWYDPVKQWAYYAYFPEGETFYDPESNTETRTIEFEKKYVYQYYVRNNEQTTSPKYETFDEVCDVLDKELRKLHGESWQPRMTREQYKNYMGDDCAISYDFFKTDTYVLFRTEA